MSNPGYTPHEFFNPKAMQENTPKFKRGDLVRKIKGSQWKGTVVGEYNTELTPEGYAVESSTEKGSVQIYPAAALELCTTEGKTLFTDGKYTLIERTPGHLVALRYGEDWRDLCGDHLIYALYDRLCKLETLLESAHSMMQQVQRVGAFQFTRVYEDVLREVRAVMSGVYDTQRPMTADTAQLIVDALLADSKDGGYDLEAGMFGPNFSKLIRRWSDHRSTL